MKKKILIALTSHDELGNTGKKTGFWLEELAAPFYVLKDAGAMITLASPKGGQLPLDPKSDEERFQTEATRRFKDKKQPGHRFGGCRVLPRDQVAPRISGESGRRLVGFRSSR